MKNKLLHIGDNLSPSLQIKKFNRNTCSCDATTKAVKAEACVGCAACGTVCPDGCITVYRMKVKEDK